MKTTLWKWVVLIVTVFAVAAAIVCYRGHRDPHPVSQGEEVAVAERLLAEKLSGPRYFNVPVSATREEGGPWIGVNEARAQVPQVAAERKLGEAGARKIERLIEKLTEPHPSRMVGGERINLPRLNLSLDEMGE